MMVSSEYFIWPRSGGVTVGGMEVAETIEGAAEGSTTIGVDVGRLQETTRKRI